MNGLIFSWINFNISTSNSKLFIILLLSSLFTEFITPSKSSTIFSVRNAKNKIRE